MKKKLPNAHGLDMTKVQKVLGPEAPSVTADRIGKYRLMESLKNKYGPNYKNHPDAKHVIKEHDAQVDHLKTIFRIHSAKGKK